MQGSRPSLKIWRRRSLIILHIITRIKNDETYINNIKKYIKEGEAKTVPLLGQTTMYPYNIIIFTTPEAYGKAFDVNPKENGAITLLNLFIYTMC